MGLEGREVSILHCFSLPRETLKVFLSRLSLKIHGLSMSLRASQVTARGSGAEGRSHS